MLPSASTWPYVITKLQGGADLMLPGIVVSKVEKYEEPTSLSGVREGQLCSVNVVGNRYAHSNVKFIHEVEALNFLGNICIFMSTSELQLEWVWL